MKRINHLFSILIILGFCNVSAQSSNDWERPHFGVGVGTFTFIGDVGENNEGYGFMISDFAYRFRISHGIYDFMDASLQFTAGRLTGNERGLMRNLNFQSEIRGGGLNLFFNFDPLLKPGRLVSPYVSIGIESFEFLSKSDMRDENGILYNYWSDGTIRDVPEHSPFAPSSVLLNRDYSYETDLRELNADGFGDYSERALAIPVGIGASVDLSPKAHFTIGTELHFTTTDLIDNISKEGEGVRTGNKGNDKFLYTWFSLNYNFNTKKKKIPELQESGDFDNLLATLDNIDSDSDGVNDFVDKCPNTPKGSDVDENGCPKDQDKDGIPDSLDSEPNSAFGAVVDANGITVEDDYFLEQYMTYIDSGKTGDIVRSSVSSLFNKANKKAKKSVNAEEDQRSYFVQVGTNVNKLDVDVIDQILSIPDVRTMNIGDSILYVVGKYDSLSEAVKRKLTLEEEGFVGRVYAEDKGDLLDVTEAVNLIEKEIKQIEAEKEIPDFEGITMSSNKLTWRVQIGAFKNQLSKNIFTDVKDLIFLSGDDGLTRYMSGAFGSIESAAEHKIDLHLKGFEGAFLTVFKGGERISISEATEGESTGSDKDLKSGDLSEILNTENTFYRVQLAKFSESIPAEILNNLMSRSDFETKTIDQESHYVAGKFKSKAEAQDLLDNTNNEIFPFAKIIGEFNGNIISVEETQQILKD